MTVSEFINSLNQQSPPSTLSPLLKAMWYDANGQWHNAHDIADSIGGEMGDWIHAYLHRKEGDLWNADYWYRRANITRPKLSLEEEWKTIIEQLLEIR